MTLDGIAKFTNLSSLEVVVTVAAGDGCDYGCCFLHFRGGFREL